MTTKETFDSENTTTADNNNDYDDNDDPIIATEEEDRVLSIQSHVVHGYVGNKAAVFPMQLLGFDVDVINSVHFSNHTGYLAGFNGDVMNGDQLCSILNGLERNGLLQNVGHVLTGYIGSASFLRSIIHVLKTIRANKNNTNTTNTTTLTKTKTNSLVRYVCDPVLGDSGKFYVPKDLVSIYRNEVIPMANVVTPNQFEVEQLTGIRIRDINDAKVACAALHDLGPELVVITSMVLLNSSKDDGNSNDDDDDDSEERKQFDETKSIAIIASRRIQKTKKKKRQQDDDDDDENTKSSSSSSSKDDDEIWRVDSPFIPGFFTGTGDLCASLLLAWTAKEPQNIAIALERVIGTMYSIIKQTAEFSRNCNGSGDGDDDGNDNKKTSSVASTELRLIQSKMLIENPPNLFKARRIQ